MQTHLPHITSIAKENQPQKMIDRFLKAKHWQLFLLTFGIPMIFEFIVWFQFIKRGSMSANMGVPEVPDLEIISDYMKFVSVLMIFFMGALFGWFWSVAVGLQRIIPAELKLKVGLFRIVLLIPILYLLLFLVFFMPAFTSGEPNLEIFEIIFPLHLLAMACIFYSLYVVAKTFKTAELQREVTFSDFAGDFFLIWFYPIGIWIIQPKINKMIKGKADPAKYN